MALTTSTPIKENSTNFLLFEFSKLEKKMCFKYPKTKLKFEDRWRCLRLRYYLINYYLVNSMRKTNCSSSTQKEN